MKEDGNNSRIVADIAEQGFVRSASAQILSAMISNGEDPSVNKAVNLAFTLNEELSKRFKQK